MTKCAAIAKFFQKFIRACLISQLVRIGEIDFLSCRAKSRRNPYRAMTPLRGHCTIWIPASNRLHLAAKFLTLGHFSIFQTAPNSQLTNFRKSAFEPQPFFSLFCGCLPALEHPAHSRYRRHPADGLESAVPQGARCGMLFRRTAPARRPPCGGPDRRPPQWPGRG